MSMMELKKMMIRMVVTKANGRDNLNCDFDDRYYDEADDGDGPTLNGSGSPSLNKSLARWLLASQVLRRSGLYYQHLLVYETDHTYTKSSKDGVEGKDALQKFLFFVTGQTSYLHRHSYRGKIQFFPNYCSIRTLLYFSVHYKAKMVRAEWFSWATSSAVVITQSKLFY